MRLQTTSLGSARDLTFSLERVFFADGRYSAWTKNAVGRPFFRRTNDWSHPLIMHLDTIEIKGALDFE